MTNNPGTRWQGIAALCRWDLAWLSIGLFTLLAGINLAHSAYGTDSSGGTMHCSGGMGAAQWRGGQEKKANAV